MILLDKIQQLKEKFLTNRSDPQDVHLIEGWEKEAKRLFLLKSLKGHDGIKYLLEVFEGEVKSINDKINRAYSKDLPDIERDRLLDRRDLAQKFLNVLLPVEDELEKLEDIINNEL